jgi:hypothetical protein
MGALPEFENVDNPQNTMPEYTSKLVQMYQYQNRSVDKFLRDFGASIVGLQFPNNAAAIAAGLKPGEFYTTVSGTDLIVKVVK